MIQVLFGAFLNNKWTRCSRIRLVNLVAPHPHVVHCLLWSGPAPTRPQSLIDSRDEHRNITAYIATQSRTAPSHPPPPPPPPTKKKIFFPLQAFFFLGGGGGGAPIGPLLPLFQTKLNAKPFIWKFVLFICEWNQLHVNKTNFHICTRPHFGTEAKDNS